MIRRSNFTLLEVVVATALLGMVGMLIAMSVSSFQQSWEHGKKVASVLERNRALDRVADTLLRSAVPFHWLDREAGSEKQVFSGESDELWLTALNRSYGGASPFLFVRLYLEDHEMKCDYASSPLLPWVEPKDQLFRTEVIARQVESLTFRYVTEDEDGRLILEETWDAEERGGLPLAIQMVLTFQDGSRQQWLRRRAGNGYYTEVLTSE